jgi:hypothetical protein
MLWTFLASVFGTLVGIGLFIGGWAFADWWTDQRKTDSTEDADSEKAP